MYYDTDDCADNGLGVMGVQQDSGPMRMASIGIGA
jgi:hypothetical protein